MDYKETLNLPRTEFPMRADLVKREPARLARWQEQGLYESVQRARAGNPVFVLHDGPPFANGDVHVGTALNKILKDILVKQKTMRGYQAPYVPGWDCHGLPIEFKVTQELRKQGGSGSSEADPVTIRRACEAYARKYIEVQRGQFQRLGVLGDWGRPYLTFDKEYEAEELRLFADLVEQGFVYRGKKPVYWSIPCRTALAEAEVEYQDHVSPSVYVKFPVVGHPGLSVLIWTTTPWTLPANLAIAYNSTFSYSVVRVGGELTIVSAMLLSTVAEKCGWDGYEIVRSLHSEQLAQIEVEHPFCARRGRLVAGDAFVESTTGTGFVHVAPGHGLEDYGLGLEHGLPIYSPVDDEGRLAYTTDLPVDQQMPAALVGKSMLERHGQSEANLAVLELLRAGGHLAHQENYSHSYPHCWRSKTPVILRAMDQWFIEIDHVRPPVDGAEAGRSALTFREVALAEISRVNWIPEWGRNRIEAAVRTRPDWCISRQRTWGVPIPAFLDAEGRPVLDARVVRRVADLIEREGSNAWFETATEALWALVKPDDWTGGDPVGRSSDTLDVWIDSGSSSRSVLMQRAELRRDGPGLDPLRSGQVDMYLEGSDQHRGWFQSSLLLGLAGNGVAPYRTVLTHGFMVDADREKISKSKQGQYDKPQTADSYVKRYGADVLRLWVSSQDFRNDIIVSEERIAKVGESYRVIRNALRFQLSNLYDFEPDRDWVPDAELTGLDRWVLGEFGSLEAGVASAYDRHEFHVVYQRVSQFAAVQLSAIYHDVVKDRLYTDPASSRRRRSTQTALYRLVRGMCQMLAPILVFTADEAWEFMPGRAEGSVHASLWAPACLAVGEEERLVWETLFGEREGALAELEKARQGKLIGKSLEAKVIRVCPPESHERLAGAVDDLKELLNVSQLELRIGPVAAVVVERAAGQKCERCWHWETDVGRQPAHPGLCGRCVDAVEA